MSEIELLSPAGSFAALQAAIDAGADSIYFGLEELNMRALSGHNFKLADLPEIASRCHEKNLKSYLALNTLLYDTDLPLMRQICQKAKEAQIDAVIASDMAALEYLQAIGQPAHLSTQLNVGNLEALKFFAKYAETIVLARELTLEQVCYLARKIEQEKITGPSGKRLKLEVFIHGALCVAISGKCQMSLALYNKSANRGECLQPCRRKYQVQDLETGRELVVDNQYIMSPKDLSTVSVLDQIVESGVSVLKIEGRSRSPEYVFKTTKTYREALRSLKEGTYHNAKIQIWQEELKSVYNRGFWEGGYYLGQPLGEWAASAGSKTPQKRTYLGKALKYFPKIQVAEFLLEARKISLNDRILIIGPKTGLIELQVGSLHTNGPVSSAVRGETIGLFIGKKIYPGDQLYLIENRS
ncbi:MAG: peptidase U32 family protein [Parachlamydiales bacterium]|jgi:putative protease